MRTSSKQYVRSSIFEHSDLGGASILTNLENEKFYGLNGVASRIWELLEKPVTIAEINKNLLDSFDVDRESCEKEVASFFDELVAIEAVEEAR